MQSTLKQLITAAVLKVATVDPDAPIVEYETPDLARDAFLEKLIAELFPESPEVKRKAKKMKLLPDSPVADVVVPMDESSPGGSVGKKKRGPMSDEAKAAMKAKRDATLAAKKAKEEPVEVLTEALKEMKIEPKKEEPKAEPKKKEEKPKKEKKAESPKKVKDANLAKIDPTWRKHLKKAAGDKYAKEQEAELLTFLNAMDKEAFNAKKAEAHIAAFLTKPEADGKVSADLTVVEFNGKDYFVNPETKRVYEGEGEYDEEVGWTNYKPVGYVGMAAFTDMSLDDE